MPKCVPALPIVLCLGALFPLYPGCTGTVERRTGQVEMFHVTPKEQILVRPGGPLTNLDNFIGTSQRSSRVGDFGDRIRFESDVLAFVVNSVYIGHLPDNLTGSSDVVLFAEVWENAAAGSSIDPLTTVVFVSQNQMIPGKVNFENNLAFGPTFFKGHPLKIRFTLMVLQKRKGEQAGSVADVVRKYSAAVPGYGQFISPAAGVMRDVLRAQPDIVAFDFETTFYSDAPEVLKEAINLPAGGKSPAAAQLQANSFTGDGSQVAQRLKALLKDLGEAGKNTAEIKALADAITELAKQSEKQASAQLLAALTGLYLVADQILAHQNPSPIDASRLQRLLWQDGRPNSQNSKQLSATDRAQIIALMRSIQFDERYAGFTEAQRIEAIASLSALLSGPESAMSQNFGWFQYGRYALIETLRRKEDQVIKADINEENSIIRRPLIPLPVPGLYTEPGSEEDKDTPKTMRRVYFIDEGFRVKSVVIPTEPDRATVAKKDAPKTLPRKKGDPAPDPKAEDKAQEAEAQAQKVVATLTSSRVKSHLAGAEEIKSTYIVFSVLPKQLKEEQETLRAASAAAGTMLTNLRQNAENLKALNDSIDKGAKDLKYAVLRSRAETLADKIASEPGQTPEGFRAKFTTEYARLQNSFGTLDKDIPATEIASIGRQATERQIDIFKRLGQQEAGSDLEVKFKAAHDSTKAALKDAEDTAATFSTTKTNSDKTRETLDGIDTKLVDAEKKISPLETALQTALALPSSDENRQSKLKTVKTDAENLVAEIKHQLVDYDTALQGLKKQASAALVSATEFDKQSALAKTAVTAVDGAAKAGKDKAAEDLKAADTSEALTNAQKATAAWTGFTNEALQAQATFNKLPVSGSLNAQDIVDAAFSFSGKRDIHQVRLTQVEKIAADAK